MHLAGLRGNISLEMDKIPDSGNYLPGFEMLQVTLANCFQKNHICDKFVRIGRKTKGEGIWQQKGENMRKTTTQISCVGLGSYKFKFIYYGFRFLNKLHFSIKHSGK